MFKRLLFCASLLAFAAACPKIERKIYTFDLNNNTGEVRFLNITTDNPEKGNNDFMDLVHQVIQGTKLEEDHPGWKITSKELVEVDGRLDGVVKFTFDDLRRIGIYQHDRKSPYIYCVDHGENESLLGTNGTRIDEVLDGCVVLDRKMSTLEVTVKAAEMRGNEQTLLPQFKKWSAGETLELVEDPMSMLGGALGGGPQAGASVGEALAGSLLGSIGRAMGLTGKVEVGTPKVDGPLASDQIKGAITKLDTVAWETCYGVANIQSPGMAGRLTLNFTVGTDGKATDASVGRELQNDDLTECLLERLGGMTFPVADKPAKVALPLDFSSE